eukprot:scaffold32520_cov108-Isochrysis_galbana.AAC.5
MQHRNNRHVTHGWAIASGSLRLPSPTWTPVRVRGYGGGASRKEKTSRVERNGAQPRWHRDEHHAPRLVGCRLPVHTAAKLPIRTPQGCRGA